MDSLDFQVSHGFEYHWCGKFISPGSEWKHLTRSLIDYELIVMTSGELYIADDKQEYHVTTGQYLLMPPTVFQHGTRPSDCTFYWLHFDYHKEENDLNKIIIPKQQAIPSIDRIIILMKQLQDSDRRYKNVSLNSFLTSAILAELSLQNSYGTSFPRKSTKEQLCHDIMDYINWNATESIRLKDISTYFGYNEKYLTTFFRQAAGIPIKQYIIQVKMDHAKAALSETNLPVSQIA